MKALRYSVLAVILASVALAADEGQVRKLVEQLKDPKKAKAAEAELVKLGPDILPFLPPTASLSGPQKKHVVAVRQALNQALVVRDLAPQRVTLKGDMPLQQALEHFAQQTKMRLFDRRLAKDNPVLKLDLDKATFWDAADAIAKGADARISLYESDHQLALRAGPHRPLPTSVHGMFRTQVKEIVTRRDFESDGHICELGLELAWEPRFQPLFLYRASKIVVKDDKGQDLQVFPLGTGRDQVTSRLATRIPLRVQAPPRACQKLSLVQGEVALVGPARMLDFTFAALDKLKSEGVVPMQAQDGIRVYLRKLVAINTDDGERWSITLELDYPSDGPEFESFEQWLINTQAVLVDRANRRLTTSEFEIPDQTGHRALITFHFTNGKKGLGKPADWKVVLTTPGRIATVPVPFQFKDVELP